MTQEEALAILKTGSNVFLTGEPGSGKSYTVNRYVAYSRSNGIKPAVTASTGIAATHIGGVTIHSWCGIGVKSSLTKQDLAVIADNKRVRARVKKATVLIIDEISMLSAETLGTVEKVCRTLRRTDMAFGGLQVVLVGDFFQLPPVIKADFSPRQLELQDFDQFDDDSQSPFAFHSPAWRMLDLTVCYLSEQHRQEDEVFLGALSAVRRGEVTDEVRNCFSNRFITDLTTVSNKVMKLFPHNANVDHINDNELAKLPGSATSFAMTTSGIPQLVEGLKRGCLSPETLNLKVDAKVMFTKNSLEGDFVNGTMGRVAGFSKESGFPVVITKAGRTLEVGPAEWAIQDDTDAVLASIRQLPLRLAWAITVHKSQGMSLDEAVMDLRSAFEYGQGYVALSRVRTLSGLHLLGINSRALEVHPVVLEQDATFRSLSNSAANRLKAMAPAELKTVQDEFIVTCQA